eukprot:760407-Hanusia_phi.AAC.1
MIAPKAFLPVTPRALSRVSRLKAASSFAAYSAIIAGTTVRYASHSFGSSLGVGLSSLPGNGAGRGPDGPWQWVGPVVAAHLRLRCLFLSPGPKSLSDYR